jgi:hypothetical protein
MKNKVLLLTTILFFLIVNTTYYWQGKLGILAFPFFLVLVVVYLVFLIALIRQIYVALDEKFANKQRLLTVCLMIIILGLIVYRPLGLIDFDKLEGENLLVANSEGAANCMTTLKLKDDFTFREKTVCFGVEEIKGTYRLQNDTIYFDNVDLGPDAENFYQYAIVKPTTFNKDGQQYDLVRYKSLKDTTAHKLWITKNELVFP